MKEEITSIERGKDKTNSCFPTGTEHIRMSSWFSLAIKKKRHWNVYTPTHAHTPELWPLRGPKNSIISTAMSTDSTQYLFFFLSFWWGWGFVRNQTLHLMLIKQAPCCWAVSPALISISKSYCSLKWTLREMSGCRTRADNAWCKLITSCAKNQIHIQRSIDACLENQEANSIGLLLARSETTELHLKPE